MTESALIEINNRKPRQDMKTWRGFSLFEAEFTKLKEEFLELNSVN